MKCKSFAFFLPPRYILFMLMEVKDLCVRYGNHEVLSKLSFALASGDFLAIVGPNGSGKTTLIKTLIGLLSPSEGKIDFEHNSRTSDKPDPAHIGYLPQKASYADPRFPASVEEVIASGLLVGRPFPGRLTDVDRKKIDEVLELLRISDLRSKRVGRLSGGQQQRVHLARALVGAPTLLVLDEPTGALDPHSRDCFYTTLSHLNEKHGVTIIIVTHDSHTIGDFAKTILYLDRKILYYGSMKEFNETPSSEHYFGKNHEKGEFGCY